MNILVSSMLLAFAILMCARSIAELRPRDKGRDGKTEVFEGVLQTFRPGGDEA